MQNVSFCLLAFCSRVNDMLAKYSEIEFVQTCWLKSSLEFEGTKKIFSGIVGGPKYCDSPKGMIMGKGALFLGQNQSLD